ncbi:MAG: homoserine dehydrogenase [Solobacterium sp.]|jgi:homoserine dehydrogenase|nr:homoserine dehydrogenase [Solobacterium sp.]MCH4048668.1 homoserine dehydrogenase [Solobacterium sp.]MCH4075641.1 homoserine dehydrogenase [Solobacterium sp.]MCI1313681.1 homoserine dehydrogenase [Solobacterium sp.]MCI1345909.1 homoserine dehydrogenase [Solobacterium sp.]
MMKIGLLGHGVVGSGVAAIIDANKTWEVEEVSVKKILVKSEAEKNDPRCTTDVNEILDDPDIDIVVECMGGLEPAHTFVKRALANGKYAVTSNKKMLAAYCEDLFEEARKHGVTIHYEAACGGGIPWMASLDRTRRVDDIQSFRGIFNGTTNYILSKMKEEGSDFDVMLKEAQKLGYAERDPSDDIDGYDVRSKVALSVVKAFDDLVDVNAISTYGIRNIKPFDLQYAASIGRTVKLIGMAENFGTSVSAFVIPSFVRDEDLFAAVPLNFNIIESRSETLGAAAFYGQGAGSLPTAHAVVQNVIDIVKNQDPEINEKTSRPVNNALHEGTFYVRTDKTNLFSSVIDHPINEHAFITRRIPLSRLDEIVRKTDDPLLFAAEADA